MGLLNAEGGRDIIRYYYQQIFIYNKFIYDRHPAQLAIMFEWIWN